MPTLLAALPSERALAEALGEALGLSCVALELRRFPDGECYIRYQQSLAGHQLIIAASLDQPDLKLVTLRFLAETARELGAHTIGLVAPYLAYMRQDQRFRDGEAVTSRYAARLLSEVFDWLVTVDPHLHRHPTLDHLFTIPTHTLSASADIAAWLHDRVTQPLLVGPDEESRQWVDAVAAHLPQTPTLILNKTRHGDRDVEITAPDLQPWCHHTPVLIDDIISTGHTMLTALRTLRDAALPPATCIAIHPVFADAVVNTLRDAGARAVVSCNTIAHPTNAIDLRPTLAHAIRPLLC